MENINQKLIRTKMFISNPLSLKALSSFYRWKDHKVRVITSPNYNTFFDYETGEFMRCGKTLHEKDDPPFAEIGPEILDMEISTICHGIKKANEKTPIPCKFCYKSNTSKGKNMSFVTFRKIFDKMPPNLTQIAFGIGDLDGHPELEDILNYCTANPQKRQVIPNITINGDRLSDDLAMLLRDNCGAVAISHYDDDICFDAIEKLTDMGMEQINIHQMISEETFEDSMKLMQSAETDLRLKGLNAIVFLSLKNKGRGKTYNPLSQDKFNQLIEYAFSVGLSIGFDSCSTFKFFNAVKDHKDYQRFRTVADPCESTLFSSYINVDGMFFPCSFTEGSTGEWMEGDGIDVVNCKHFITDVWEHPKTVAFREKLIGTAKCNSLDCRECPIFKV